MTFKNSIKFFLGGRGDAYRNSVFFINFSMCLWVDCSCTTETRSISFQIFFFRTTNCLWPFSFTCKYIYLWKETDSSCENRWKSITLIIGLYGIFDVVIAKISDQAAWTYWLFSITQMNTLATPYTWARQDLCVFLLFRHPYTLKYIRLCFFLSIGVAKRSYVMGPCVYTRKCSMQCTWFHGRKMSSSTSRISTRRLRNPADSMDRSRLHSALDQGRCFLDILVLPQLSLFYFSIPRHRSHLSNYRHPKQTTGWPTKVVLAC